jgi:hypothetical protein
MRRLDILLVGHSQALTDLALELEQHGHVLMRVKAGDALMPKPVDLLIDDATLTVQRFKDVPRLTLQLGIGLPGASGLPSLDLLCLHGCTLVSRVPIADEPSGNGQSLRLRAVAELVDHAAAGQPLLQGRRLFLLAGPTPSAPFERVESLLFLEPGLCPSAQCHANACQLAQTANDRAAGAAIDQSADRPALNIAGTHSTTANCITTAEPSARFATAAGRHQAHCGGICCQMQRVVCGNSGDPRLRRCVSATGAEPSVAASAIHPVERRRGLAAA